MVASKLAMAAGAKVLHSPTIDSAMTIIRSGKQINIIFIDVDQDIESLGKAFQKEHISLIPIIACGIVSDAVKAVRAIEAGAKEYLPLPPQAELIAAIFEAISNSNEIVSVIATSDAIKDLLEVAAQVANSNAAVLITGESGSGKEVIAKYIHSISNRSSHELIAINCAAIPENLLESELFGHEKGAFTGANEKRIGKFEAANNSTILLDEISEMDIKLQAKLLRVLQEREITRIGGNSPVKLNLRVIATSNRDLLEHIKEGKFREDLFYRLNVINLKIPSLSERRQDITALIDHFMTKYSQLNSIPNKKLSALALTKMLDYNWPGNIRELENCVHRALLLSKTDEISPQDIMLINQSGNMNQNLKTLAQIEHAAISQTIGSCQGDELKASMILGISIRTLKQKLKQYQTENLL